MNKLQQRAEHVAEAKAQKIKTDVKRALTEELPSDLAVKETDDGVVVSGHGLGTEMVGNSSLRDVAFLMRGVR